MARLCIEKSVAEKMKKAFADGSLSVQSLYDMTSGERRQAFGKYVSTDLSEFININFEKAMVSSQKDALLKWAESVFKPSEKKKQNYKSVMDKINDLEKMGALNTSARQGFVESLIAEKLGITVTPDELKNIAEKAARLEQLYENFIDKDGLPSVEYFQALTDMDRYVNSLTPTHNLKVITGTIFRANMLLNIPPATVNIISNSVQGVMQAFERRLAGNQYKNTNKAFALKVAKRAVDIYIKTGWDITRMYAYDVRLGEHIVHSEGEGLIRKVGRGMSTVVFKYMQGFHDMLSSTAAWTDSVTLLTTKLAEKEGLKGEAAQKRALAIFKDALKAVPDTMEGIFVREQAQADAKLATWTSDTWIGKIALESRGLLNKATGDLQLGYMLSPFIKTTANVIQLGLDSAGLSAFEGGIKLPEAIRQMKDGNMKPMQDVIRLFVRAGMGVTLSYLLAGLFDPDDFIGGYDALTQKQRDEVGLKNGVYNAIKIGGKWVSLDYFGALGAGFVGMMYARKYGNGGLGGVYQYARGVVGQSAQIPGLRDVADAYQSIVDAAKEESIGKSAEGIGRSFINFARSRVIPGFVNTIAQATDPYVRKTDRGPLSKGKAAIPVARQTLPVKVNPATGEEVKGEGFISQMLFGNRVKTAADSELVDEIVRLNNAGFGPAIANIEYSSSRIKALKEQQPEKYEEAVAYFSKEYGRLAKLAVNRPIYRRMDDEKKMKRLNQIRSDVLDKTLAKYKYRKTGKRVL